MLKTKFKEIDWSFVGLVFFLGLCASAIIYILLSASTGRIQPAHATISQYEVDNVSVYVQEETNGFGATTGSHIAYSFTYVDENGNIKEESDFENLEYGLTKVKIGDKSYYEINNNGMDCYRTLYLTKKQYKALNQGVSEDG